MLRQSRLIIVALLALSTVFAACKGSEEATEPEAFSFVVYPGARYLGKITDMTKEAHRKIIAPGQEPPPTAIYDTEASVEEVTEYYAKQYGYKVVDASTNLSTARGNAFYRTGDLAADAKAIAPMLEKMGLPTEIKGAIGPYKGAEIAPKPNRPRVTIQRPYIDVVNSTVVDRTFILMTR